MYVQLCMQKITVCDQNALPVVSIIPAGSNIELYAFHYLLRPAHDPAVQRLDMCYRGWLSQLEHRRMQHQQNFLQLDWEIMSCARAYNLQVLETSPQVHSKCKCTYPPMISSTKGMATNRSNVVVNNNITDSGIMHSSCTCLVRVVCTDRPNLSVPGMRLTLLSSSISSQRLISDCIIFFWKFWGIMHSIYLPVPVICTHWPFMA